MATKIVTKNSSTASAVPTASDLVQGELAVNVADKRLFTEDNGGSIVELGTNPSTIDINAGSIDGTAIGASSASTGAFTTLTATGLNASGTAVVGGLQARATGNIEVGGYNGGTDYGLILSPADGSTWWHMYNDAGGHLAFGHSGTVGSAEKMRIDSSGKLVVGRSSAYASGKIQSFVDHTSGFASPSFVAADSTAMAAGVGGEIGFYGKYSAADDYAFYGGIKGFKENGTDSNTACALSFYTRATGTAATERMRIDSSGNVNIGSTNSGVGGSIDLSVGNTSSTGGITLWSPTNGTHSLGFGDGYTGTDRYRGYVEYSHSDDSMRLATGSTERLRIDSSGNLLFNGNGVVSVQSNSSNFYLGGGSYSPSELHLESGALTAFKVNGSERMRIDSSGNLLVGQTSNAETGTGIGLVSDGTSHMYSANTDALMLGRGGSDGDILSFNKSGTTVGKIATRSSGISIGNPSRGILFAGDTIYPENPSTLSLQDATINLGASAARFKDLYLSGAVYSGGTFSAGTTGNSVFFAEGSAHIFRRGSAGSYAEFGRFDTSGNLLVGKTSSSFDTQGVAFRGSPAVGASGATFTRDDDNVAAFNRLNSDGSILTLNKDGTTVGSIGTSGGDLYIGTGDTVLAFLDGGDFIAPWNTSTNAYRDNAVDLGTTSGRFDDIYATNGTIQTSDRNEKQDIEALSDAEQRVAVACKGLLRKFRWKDSVAEKGDEARTHFGIIAQDLQAAFVAEGLDAGDYAMFISTTWTDEETNEEKTRMGVRYSELLAFIIAAI